MKEPITTAAAAAVLGLSPSRVRELAAGGALPGVRVGRDWLFDRLAVVRFGRTPRRGRGRPRKGDGT